MAINVEGLTDDSRVSGAQLILFCHLWEHGYMFRLCPSHHQAEQRAKG